MVSVVINVRGAREAILRTRRVVRWRAGLHRPLSELLKRQHERRIQSEKTAPDGRPWEPLKASTIERKKRRGNSDPENILIDSHAMAGNFRVAVNGDVIRLRNPTRYTIRHQGGTRWMVARPFLGLSNPNIAEIRRLVVSHVRRVVSNDLGIISGG